MITSIDKAALELFKVYGFKNVTMDDIARRCGHSKKTLYERYESKEALVQSVLYYMFDKLEVRLNYITNQQYSIIEKLKKYYEETLTFCKPFHPVFLHSLKISFSELYTLYDRQVDAIITDKIIPLYRKAKAAGIIIQEVNEEDIAGMHKDFFHFLVFKSSNLKVRFDTIEIYMRRLLPSFRGMLTPAYISIIDTTECKCKLETIELT